MKQLSTGSGLTVLGISAIACVVLSNTRLGAPAEAAPPQEEARIDSNEVPPSAPTLKVAPCGVEQWFDPTPRLFASTCGSAAFNPASPADVNRDGLTEVFYCPEVSVAGGCQGFVSGIPTNDILSRALIEITPSGPATKQMAVMPVDATFGNALAAQLPTFNDNSQCGCSGIDIRVQVIGWADCDGDGDLDAVFRVRAIRSWLNLPCTWSGNTQVIWDQTMWCKNIGFESQIFGDLDNDGHVGTSDISMLLLNFTD